MSTQPIHSEHWTDAVGRPAGGITSGTGLHITWQNGPLRANGEDTPAEPNGAFVEGVIQAALDRLEFYQASEFACVENAEAIFFLKEALDSCSARTAAREARGVEGTHSL